jgi:RimJ/RimL family protein N-acetyltransferase
MCDGHRMAAPRDTIPTLRELPLVIETNRLRLRPFVDADVDAIWPVVSDPTFPKYMSWSAHTRREETLEFIRRINEGIAKGTGITWAIEHEGHVIGCVGLDGIQWQLRAWRVDRAELGYWIATAWWNKGMMTEAATAVVRTAFDVVGLHKITVGCFAENDASRRVIEKVGFRYIGRLDDDVWRDGRWWSHLRYELTAPEWPDVHTTLRVNRPSRS